ncbi:hypothetical protein [Dickeya phage Coodle]|uniref:Uncharacterized protein n=1 Tax=Dickeya phage Coodle TaxID=2320188 RepID=A0A3G2K8S7_9CAUD|nr:hypothetical protein [Dickeya phage Coodle]
MYKFRINRERNSFKFGVVAGVCLFLFGLRQEITAYTQQYPLI